jgi:hypothetical protein
MRLTTRVLWTLVLMTGVVAIAPLGAQERQAEPGMQADTLGSDRNRIEGKVSTKDPANLVITINVEGEPGGEATIMTVPYTAKDSVEFEKFQVDDWVSGFLVVEDSRTYIEDLKLSSEQKVKEGGLGDSTTRPN